MASRVMSSDPCDSKVSPTATSSKYLVMVLPPVWSVVSSGEHAGRDPEMPSTTCEVMAGWRLGARARSAHGGAGAAVGARWSAERPLKALCPLVPGRDRIRGVDETVVLWRDNVK